MTPWAGHPVKETSGCRTIDEARILDTLLLNGFAETPAADRRHAPLAIARAALADCRAHGLAFARAADGSRTYDPVEAWNVITRRGARGEAGFWRDHSVAAARARIWRNHPGAPDGDGPPPRPDRLAPARYAVDIHRTYNLRDRRPGERLRLRLPLPLEDPAHEDLTVEVAPLPPTAIRAQSDPGRLEVLIAPPPDGQARVGWRAEFTAHATPRGPFPVLGAEDRALYTRPVEGLIKVDDRISALAARLAGGETDPSAVARRFWDFVLGAVGCGAVPYEQLAVVEPLHWALDTGWGDCRTGSALLAALCRARGVPARLVSGYMLDEAAPAFHTWLEVWIEGEGWSPRDLRGWALSLAGRDLDWRDYFHGGLDHRLVVERPPRLFTGLGSIRLPRRWRMLGAATDTGSRMSFVDGETGDWVYYEELAVRRL